MQRLLSIGLFLQLTLPAAAETLDQAERRCRGELLRGARAVCLSYQSEQREAAMEARIASTLAGLQAARPTELRALAIRYREAQAAWRTAVAEGCEGEDDLTRELCRLEAVLAREEQVAESLARAEDDLGARVGIEIPPPEGVEVLIPLELPPGLGRGDEKVRVPLWVPVLP